MKTVLATIIIYSLMSPIGCAIGTAIETSNIKDTVKDGVILLLECLAAGRFVYVTFLEVRPLITRNIPCSGPLRGEGRPKAAYVQAVVHLRRLPRHLRPHVYL